jgi:F420-non-reducing hydrogenase iron-sulfur subunit
MMLEDFGLEPERFRIEWIASSEAQKFADVMTDMTEALRALGPSAYSTRG